MAYLPDDWIDIIEKARTRNPFLVNKMDGTDVQNFSKAADLCIKKTPRDQFGEQVKLTEVIWFSYGMSEEKDFVNETTEKIPHPNEVWVRYSHNEMEPLEKSQRVYKAKLMLNRNTRSLLQSRRPSTKTWSRLQKSIFLGSTTHSTST